MRIGVIFGGLVGAVIIGVMFWMALFGFVQLSRTTPAPVAGGPGLALAPAPALQLSPPGQAQTQPPAAAPVAQSGSIKVVASDLKFDQKEIRVAVGQPVEIVLENKGVLEHDFVVDELNVRILAQGGQTAKGTFTPTKEGSYEFICSIPGHKEAGMVGKLIVGPAAGAAPATRAAAPAQQPSQPLDQPKAQPAPANLKPLAIPQVAPPLNRTTPTTVRAEIESQEVTALLDDGVAYTFWTFGGTVPGPMLRVMEGDTVELTFKNALDSKVTHSIDLHAVTGPGGGAKATQMAPGESSTIRFKALNPGVYIYHCATPMVAHHIASGMYGLIVVEPAGGLPKVDQEFYVVQGDFYLQGAPGEKGLRGFSVEKMLDERPDYVLFNGSVGALTKENALKARVGETVRIFFGVGGPNVTSSFHVIGEIFDRVHPEGSSEPLTNVQTTLVPSGGATMVEFKADYPGDYILVDHSLGRLQKGGAAILTVEGQADASVFEVIKGSAHGGGH
jgi:nitrite reductase (NO-forming)